MVGHYPARPASAGVKESSAKAKTLAILRPHGMSGSAAKVGLRASPAVQAGPAAAQPF